MAGTYIHNDKSVSYSNAGAVASYGMLGGLGASRNGFCASPFPRGELSGQA
jgi:hypothetical protein